MGQAVLKEYSLCVIISGKASHASGWGVGDAAPPPLFQQMAAQRGDNCIHIKPETAWEVILEQNDSFVHDFLVAAVSRFYSAY